VLNGSHHGRAPATRRNQWLGVVVFLVQLGSQGLVDEFFNRTPGQLLSDPVDRIFGNAAKDLAQIALRIKSTQFGGVDEAAETRGSFTARIRSAEYEVLPSETYCTRLSFHGIVVEGASWARFISAEADYLELTSVSAGLVSILSFR
jgi:hypothetical protein